MVSGEVHQNQKEDKQRLEKRRIRKEAVKSAKIKIQKHNRAMAPKLIGIGGISMRSYDKFRKSYNLSPKKSQTRRKPSTTKIDTSKCVNLPGLVEKIKVCVYD